MPQRLMQSTHMFRIDKLLATFNRRLRKANIFGVTSRVDASAQVSGSVIGNATTLSAHTTVNNSVLNGQILIGAHSIVGDCRFNGDVSCGEHCRLSEVEVFGPLEIGRYSSLWGPGLSVHSIPEAPVAIGNFCSIGRGTTFQTFGHNHRKLSTYFMGKNFFNERWPNEKTSKGETRVGHDVWIGAHAVILGGVNIGTGAVVAANSVVTGEVPPYAIVAGAPARVIGRRFEENVVDQLLQLEWWTWPEEKIRENKFLFEGEFDETLLQKVK